MIERCSECKKEISARAKANVWQGNRVVCTPCLKELKAAESRTNFAIAMAGNAHTPWLVHDGKHQHGPFTTEELAWRLCQGKVDFGWNIWREGMTKWVPAARLFTIPSLSPNGRCELREHGQGDGRKG